MNNLSNELKDLLAQDDRLMVDNSLLTNQVVEFALKLDKPLLKLLLSHPRLKQHFFVEVEDVLVFDQEKFIQFVNNKTFLPDSYTSFKNKIGLTSGNDYLQERGEVALVWPYKDCVLQGGQDREDAKRDEVFWNEILAPDEIDHLFDPKVLTNFKRYDIEGEHTVTEIHPSDNLMIKGNNLLALHSLKKRFAGKVKLIYIDPPYNTGSDSFKYNDRFKHSTWLTFMKNRLQIARDLLSQEGIIWLNIDDNESHYLKVLADEIFGASNFMTAFYVQVRYENKTLVEDMDYQKLIETILVYRKSEWGRLRKDEADYTIDKFVWEIKELAEPRTITLGGKRVDIFFEGQYEILEGKPSYDNLKEIWASGKILDGNSSGRFFRDYLMGRYNEDGYGVLYKVYHIGDDPYDYRYFTGPKKKGATKGKYYQGVPQKRLNSKDHKKYIPIANFEDFADAFGNCRHEGGVELRSGKKPERLLKRIIELSTQPGDLVLDFFVGSGTTAAVAHKMKRQYIGIEQLDYGQNESAIRLKNVINGDQTGVSRDFAWTGGGRFVSCELMRWNQLYIDQIETAANKEELQTIWLEMQEKAFLSCRLDLAQFNEHTGDFANLGLDDQKKFLLEVLDKNQLYVNLSEMDDVTYEVSEEDKILNRQFYGLE